MANTPNFDIPMPDERDNFDDEMRRLQLAWQLVDGILKQAFDALATKATVQHSHEIAQVQGLAQALADKMAADRKFTLGELSNVIGATEAATGYILTKNADGRFVFASPASVLGNHGHTISQITGLEAALAEIMTTIGGLDSRYYTKTQVDTNTYSRTQADVRYYTKTDTDALLRASVSPLTSTIMALTLEFADWKGQRMGMKGGVADPFDTQDGVNRGTMNGLDENTLLLMHFDGAQGKQVLPETSWSRLNADQDVPHVWSFRGPANGCYIDTSQSKFGGSSLRFMGSAGAGYFHGNNHPDFAFAAGQDFTIEFQVRFASMGAGPGRQMLFDSSGSTSTNARNFLSVDVDAKLYWYFAGGNRIVGTTVLAVDTWYHIAIQMRNGVVSLSLNGVQEGGTYNYGTASVWYVNASVGSMWGAPIQGGGLQQLDGWMDELRISNVSRWTLPFTPPTGPYGPPTGTQTTKQIYDAANGWYRPADLKSLVYQIALDLGVANPERASRMLVPSRRLEKSGAYVRFRFNLANAIGIKAASFGPKAASGNAWDFAAPPIPITFNGGQLSLFVAGANPTPGALTNFIWSDWVLGNIDNTKDYIIAVDHGATSSMYYTSNVSPDMLYFYKAGAVTEASVVAPTGYTTSTPQTLFVDAIQVKDLAGPSENMVIESVAYPLTSVPSSGRAVVQMVDGVSLIPNTDFVFEVSRNNGGNYTAGALTVSTSLGGVTLYEAEGINLAGQPSGNSLKWRFRSLTNKRVTFSGAVAQLQVA